uniref:Coiled-coil domain containing 148 n=1 Tax=Malurus cyaneus samueli TaxID=2593467 RepID=A0A8C5TJR6_9PASS
KPVDYKHLYQLAAQAKMASAQIQLKIKKTEQISKISKEQMLLKQHRQVWWQEHKRLTETRCCVTFLGVLESFMFHPEQKLSKERDTYQTNTLVPVWQLKEDLKFQLAEMQRSLSKESLGKPSINSIEVLQQVAFPCQFKFIERVNVVQSGVLSSISSPQALVNSSEEKNGVFLAIPPELLCLECPYPELKALVISEYQELSSGVWARLQEVDQQLEALSSDWKEEDQWVFQTVINQYPSDLQRRRTLYLDMLQRYLPHKSRHELVAQEKAQAAVHSIRSQRRALLLSWAQQSRAFVLRAVAAAAEASAAHEAQVLLADSRQKQLQICAELKAKVWSHYFPALFPSISQQFPAFPHALFPSISQQLPTIPNIPQYFPTFPSNFPAFSQQFPAFPSVVSQRFPCPGRVQFRRALLEQRLLQKKELELLQARQEQEKEKRLEALRQQVAIVARVDPARAVADTVASRARMGIGANEELELQQPLFKLHTYSEEQVISDPRLRVELALREAGLHKTPYAREVLSKLPPPKLPRRDMESTAFKL